MVEDLYDFIWKMIILVGKNLLYDQYRSPGKLK